MNRNIEIKARVRDFEALLDRVVRIADSGPIIIDQEDTFFRSRKGRLKLRKFSESEGELIFYDRPDAVTPTECNYVLLPVSTPKKLCRVLSDSLGIRGVVRKRRTLYLAGQTRIHLDDVEGLGRFVELEVVLRDGQSSSDGERIAHDLMSRLGIDESELLERAYIDLLEQETG
jgi:predicted adenylyl cyclase CyaB